MSNQLPFRILIIGAGPAGLAIGGRLRKLGIDFTIFEQSEHVGDRWRRHYDRLHLHSVKRLSHLPHKPFPDHYPTFVPRQQVVDYLEDYSQTFKLLPQFGQRVEQVVKNEIGEWEVTTNLETTHWDHVIVATGVNNRPWRPQWPGLESFEGTTLHSIDYKNPKPFLNSRTLVVGMGNTGAELALDLSEHGVETYLSVRGALNIVPRELNGQPVQETALLLDKIPFGIGEWLGAQIQRIYFGDLAKYGITKSKVKPVVQLKETGKTPIIDIGTVKAIKQGRITVIPEVVQCRQSGVDTNDGHMWEIDHIIFATGYRSLLNEYIDQMDKFTDGLGYPSGPIGLDYHDRMYFVGFDNYQLGGILGTIYKDSEAVAKRIAELRHAAAQPEIK